jgi:hypothetical protein
MSIVNVPGKVIDGDTRPTEPLEYVANRITLSRTLKMPSITMINGRWSDKLRCVKIVFFLTDKK